MSDSCFCACVLIKYYFDIFFLKNCVFASDCTIEQSNVWKLIYVLFEEFVQISD